METRKLTPTDLDQIEDLVSSRWEHVRKRRQSEHDKTLINRLFEYSKNNTHELPHLGCTYSYGAFDETGKLISAITQKFIKELPSCYISNMVVRPSVSNLYDVGSMGLAACVDEAVHFAESAEYFKWYWTTELRGWNHREEQWYNNCSAFRRYHVFIEKIFKRGEKTDFSFLSTMLGENGATADMAIKLAVLKPEFLHRYYQHKGILTEDFVSLQYRKLDQKDLYVNNWSWIKPINVTETTLEFFSQYKDQLDEGKILLDMSLYPPHIALGEHRYFKAEIDGELAGLSAMTRYLDEDGKKNRIYHRAAYVFPKYRKQGVWRSLMKHKIKYMLEHNWPTDAIHTVSVSYNDRRYVRDNWTLYKDTYQDFNDTGEVINFPRRIWISRWDNIKKNYLD